MLVTDQKLDSNRPMFSWFGHKMVNRRLVLVDDIESSLWRKQRTDTSRADELGCIRLYGKNFAAKLLQMEKNRKKIIGKRGILVRMR